MEATNELEESTASTTEDSTITSLERADAMLAVFDGADKGVVASFCKQADEAYSQVKALSDELKASFHICPQVSQKLISKQSAEEYYTLLEYDTALRDKTRAKLESLTKCTARSEAVLEVLPRIVAKKPVLDQITDLDLRRSAKNVVGNFKDLDSDLTEWKKSARRGLEKIAGSSLPEKLGLEELFSGEDTDSKKKSRKRSARRDGADRKRGRKSGAKEEDTKAEEKPSGFRAKSPAEKETSSAPKFSSSKSSSDKSSDSHSGSSDSPKSAQKPPAPEPEPIHRAPLKAAKKAAPPVSADEEQFMAALTQWAEANSYLPKGLARTVRVASSREFKAKLLEANVLWGQRKMSTVSVPYRGGPVDEEARPTSLWDLPSTPPQGFQDGEEKGFRVSGSDRLEDCSECSGAGTSECKNCSGSGLVNCTECGGTDSGSCDSCDDGRVRCVCNTGASTCATCGGKQRVLRYDFCETNYTAEEYSRTFAKGRLQGIEVSKDDGRQVYQDFVLYQPTEAERTEQQKKFLGAVAKHAGSAARDDLLDRYFDFRGSDKEDGECQLIRLNFRITEVSVQEFSCEPLEGVSGVPKFKAWLVGTAKRLHVDGVSESFGAQNISRLVACLVGSVPLGYGVIQLLARL